MLNGTFCFCKSPSPSMVLQVVLFMCVTDFESSKPTCLRPISKTKFGSHLLSTVGLVAEHIKNIRQKYKRHEGWLAPFPWCEDFQFQLSDIYTRLRMVSREKKARATAEQRVVETTEIFNPHEECKQARKVLIEGKPGIGKTTYCNKVAYDWAINIKKEGGCFLEFEMVLLLKCRDVEIESDLWGAIDDQLLPGEIQRKEREKFFEYIRQNQSKVLLILDGLDELPPDKLPEFTDIIQGKMLPLCHLVVTARHEAGIPVRKVCDTLLEIEGFTYQDSEEFILKYFAGKEDLAEKLLDKIRNEKRLEEMTANPLNTALLCLLCEDFQGILPESRTQLYMEVVQCVLIRYRKKKGFPVENDQDLIEIYKDQLKRLGLIALNGLYEDNMYFEDKKLSNKDADLPGFGFLSAQPGSSKRRPCMCYGFTHKSFQEFFAGHYLCCQLVNKKSSPEILVTDPRYFRELREVLKFTCGLLAVRSEESAVALINCIANEVNKADVEECLPVALECIKECKIENSCFHIDLARTFGASLKVQQAQARNHGVIDDAAAAVLAAVLEANTTLTNLDLQGNNIGPTGAESLATALKTNTTLTHLDLSGNNIAPGGAVSLATALKTNTTLTNLDLQGNNIGPGGAVSLAAALKTNTTLTKLDLQGNNIGPFDAESLATALKTNTTLTNLCLSYGNNIGPAGVESLAKALKTNTTLTDLDLSGNDIGPAGAESLATALKTNTTLTNLDLSGNNIGPGGAVSLATALKTNTTLTNLDLRSNNIGPFDAESLATALKTNTTLTNLYLSYGNNIGPAGAESLAKALKTNTTLTDLDLSGNNIGSAGAESLATALKTNTTLTDLDLSENNIGPVGVESLATALKTNTTLTHLYLYHNNIGPAGAESLAIALKTNTILTKLDLSDNNIGPGGAESLATALKTNTTLTNVDLSDNNIGPAGAESLATALKTNTSLTKLTVSGWQ